MKKILKFLAILLLAIIALLISLPFIFKGQLIDIAQKEINKQVKAEVSMENFGVSIFKSFPKLTLSLEGLSVKGVDQFQDQTLVSFESFDVAVDLVSVITKNIEVNKISLIKPEINGVVLQDGTANWDVAPSSEETEETIDDTTSTSTDFKVALTRFEIVDAKISFTDYQSGMEAHIEELNYDLSGNLGLEETALVTHLNVNGINFKMDGIRYARDMSMAFMADLHADMVNNIFTLKENQISINELTLNMQGNVEMKDEDIITKLTFATTKTEFKTLLSMVPAIYMKDFEGLQTAGELALSGEIDGIYSETDNLTPSAKLNLNVANAMFKYPDLPKSVDNIAINVDVNYDGVNNDNTTVDVNQFHVELGGNPFDMALHLSTPMSDPGIKTHLKGSIDFSSLNDVVPLKNTTIQGLLTTNLEVDGNLSTIEAEKYEEFKALGSVILENFVFNSPDVPQPVEIVKTELNFSPKLVDLATFDIKMASSDFHLDGKLENFIPYALSDGTIRGQLNFMSSLIDANELIPENSGDEEIEEVEDTTAMTVVEIPGNIDFELNTNIKSLRYDKLDITNVLGKITVKDQKATLHDLIMKLADGTMTVSGDYNTQNSMEPKVDFNFDISNFDIQKAANSFSVVDSLAPIAKDCVGKISMDLKFNSLLDNEMKPILPSVNGSGSFSSQNIAISGNKTFNKLADALKNEKFREVSVSDLDVNFEIIDGRIYIEPFDTKINSMKAVIGGDHGLDQTINYNINMTLPPNVIGSAASELMAKYTGSGNVNVNALVTGTTVDPKVSLDVKETAGSIVNNMKEEAKEKVQQELDKKKEEARKKAQAQADKLITEAEREAQGIRDNAKKAADAIRKEADDKAAALIKEAGSNPIKKKVAEATADKLKKEAYDKADKLEKEADSKATALVTKAKAEAAKLDKE